MSRKEPARPSVGVQLDAQGFVVFPEGVIDPYLKSISFYNGEKRLAVLTNMAAGRACSPSSFVSVSSRLTVLTPCSM